MTDKILPLGSVVTLKNGDDTEVMIVSRASVIEVEDGQGGTKSVYFDYGSVVIPNGCRHQIICSFSIEKMSKKFYLRDIETKMRRLLKSITILG